MNVRREKLEEYVPEGTCFNCGTRTLLSSFLVGENPATIKCPKCEGQLIVADKIKIEEVVLYNVLLFQRTKAGYNNLTG